MFDLKQSCGCCVAVKMTLEKMTLEKMTRKNDFRKNDLCFNDFRINNLCFNDFTQMTEDKMTILLHLIIVHRSI